MLGLFFFHIIGDNEYFLQFNYKILCPCCIFFFANNVQPFLYERYQTF
ncbi:hypothetical protein HMPREF0653_01774 [Prevotella disiens JCM 6334 = ATCC 29426]|uniref:Uncharacterized protein n=1 Tax=Prevotella disiens JCM 6334 = ATCC 29426 TaxID=1235811 RepID=A0ABN0NQY8_9BACT|nr:hypothetical protein HMPREF0653_01774 [Prevotella disiens JCM 6334 = ATCC 29426]